MPAECVEGRVVVEAGTEISSSVPFIQSMTQVGAGEAFGMKECAQGSFQYL